MFVTDYNGQVKEEQSLKALEQLLVPDEVSPGFLQNEEYVGIEASSEVSGLSYYLFVQQDIFWKEARRVRNIHLLSLLLTLLAGAGAVWFLLRRNFKPLSVLLHKIGNESGQKEEKRNEYDRIEKAYSRIHNENLTMKKTIRSQEKVLVGSYLLALLKGRSLKTANREQEAAWGLPFSDSHFMILGISVPPVGENLLSYDELIFFMIDNVLAELMEGETFYRVEDGRFLYYIFCILPGNEQKVYENCLEKASFLYDFFEEKLNLSLTIVLSGTEYDAGRLKILYQNVMEAFEYKRILGGSGVVCTKDLQKENEDTEDGFHICCGILAEALQQGDFEKVNEISGKLFADAGEIPFIVLRLRMIEVFLVVADTYNETIIDSVKRMQLMHYLELLLNAQDLRGLKEEYHKLISFACSKISRQWEAENKKLVQDITEYVEKNYTDSNLNINYIAQVLQRNRFYDYFYHVFFRRNDTGLSECEEFGTSGLSVGADSSGSN